MVKRKIEWSLNARLDLYDVLDFYIKRNGTATYSKSLNSKIIKSVKQLSSNPSLGTQTDFVSVRTYISGNYQIIYEVFDQLILIIMIWDCRRSPESKRIGQRFLKND